MSTPLRMTPAVARRGFTLVEMLVAVTLLLFVFAMVVPFMRVQTRQIGTGAGRLDALQNARFSQNAIDRELRIAGVGATQNQPMIAQADPMAVTFNADLATRDSSDPDAIYYDPNVDTAAVGAMAAANAITLPRSSTTFPQIDYQSTPGIMGSAETVSYWLSRDSTSSQSDAYVLWRRVNNSTAKVVSTGLRVPSGTAFFQYFKINTGTGTLDSIPAASLPLFHPIAQHGSPADTGAAALIDSVRAVRMTVTGVYVDPQLGAVYRTVSSTTKLLNAGLLNHATCGFPPLPVPAAPAATKYGSVDSVTLTWTASPDQNGGEQSVQRYLVYAQQVGAASWGDPVADIPATVTSYDWSDPSIASMHGQWQFSVVAQDCTPANSTLMTSNTVTLP